MKLGSFFDQANTNLEMFISLLEQSKTLNPTGQAIIISCDTLTDVQELARLFSIPAQPKIPALYSVSIGVYLNQLIDEIHHVISQHREESTTDIDSKTHDMIHSLAVGLPAYGFFFAPMAPLTLIHDKKIPHDSITLVLKRAQQNLALKKQCMLANWTFTQANIQNPFSNTLKGIDWLMLMGFMEPTTDAIQPTIIFENNDIHKHPFELTRGRISFHQFEQLQSKQGIRTKEAQRFTLALTTLITLEHDDTEYLAKTKQILRTFLQKNDLDKAHALANNVLKKSNESNIAAEKNFYSSLQQAVLSYQPHGLVNIIDPEQDVILFHTRDFKPSFLSNTEQRLIQLENTLTTLPALTEPYHLSDEALLTRYLLNGNDIISTIEELKRFSTHQTTTSEQRTELVSWFKSTMRRLLHNILQQCLQLHYYQYIIRLSEASLKLMMAIHPDANSILALKDVFMNACLNSGHYEILLHWLNYFETLPITLSETTPYEFFYAKAVNHNLRSVIFQLHDELDIAKHHIDQARASMDHALERFIGMRDFNLAIPFMQATARFLKNHYLAHQALAAALLESNDFTDAIESFSVHNEIINPSTFNSIIRRINNFFNLRIQTIASLHDEDDALLTAVKIKMRWCETWNLIQIRRWLKEHSGKSTRVFDKNEKLHILSLKHDKTKKLASALKKQSIPHEKKGNEIILSNFGKINIKKFKMAFGLTIKSSPPTTLSLSDSLCRSLVSKDQLRYRLLKSDHTSFLDIPEAESFENLSTRLNEFYVECESPILKLKTLQLLVSLMLRQSFNLWVQNMCSHQNSHLEAAKQYALSAHQLVADQFEKTGLQDSNAQKILVAIDTKISHHNDLLLLFLKRAILKNHQKTLQFFTNQTTHSGDCFYWIQLGGLNMLNHYSTVTAIRDELLTKTICHDQRDYLAREQLLGHSTLLCFELAYELYSQPSLAFIEGNTSDVARKRIEQAHHTLCETQKDISLEIPDHIQSYILVCNFAPKNQHDEDAVINQFNQALKLSRRNSNLLHKVDIILRKIDCLCESNKITSFQRIFSELQALRALLKSYPNANVLDYRHHIIALIANFISKNLTFSYEAIAKLPKSLLDVTIRIFRELLNILVVLEASFLKQNTSSGIHQGCQESVTSLKRQLNNAIKITNSFELEQKVTENLLIPKVLNAQAALQIHSGPLLYPQSPLIPFVNGCQAMLDYSASQDGPHCADQAELLVCYELITTEVKQFLTHLMPRISLSVNSQDDAGSLASIELFTRIIMCLNNAHLAKGKTISPEHLPMIKSLCSLHPDNLYLTYTLYRALAQSTPKTTPSPEIVAACRSAALGEHPQAQYYYSKILHGGYYGEQVNLNQGRVYLALANEQAFYKAQLRLAKCHRSGLFGYDQNQKSARCHAKAAMSNEETPWDSKAALCEEYDIPFLPYQCY